MSDCECVATKSEDGIPAWVMTFADLMSLLLAFFVLLFSFSEMDKNTYKELAGSLKEAFGVQREVKAKETPRGINIIAREFSPGRPKPTVHNEVRQMTTDENRMFAVFTDSAKEGQENQNKEPDDLDDKTFNSMQEKVNDDDSIKDESVKAEAVKDEAVKDEAVKAEAVKAEKAAANAVTLSEEDIEMVKRINKDSELLREALDEEINQGLIDMQVTDKRIILMVREKGSFLSGSAKLIEPFKVVVDKISEVFGDFDGVIIVSGHTDNVPINTYRFRSNWELSSSRAVSVIHELVKASILKDKRFEIAAYADTKPADSNDTVTGRAKNRRVEIMMDYSKNKAADHADKDDASTAKSVYDEDMSEANLQL